ncbi:hypothetical protein C6P45_000458 [Maudiozyma exigua]|uniref:Uncharacterized protein n=1 Tax=Maudiozyma exigua TaxID=34358 RepID=A0A9P7B893_MAUEX|nr:hypothetical protein C6P45_000458 [Kazachstania exigua]
MNKSPTVESLNTQDNTKYNPSKIYDNDYDEDEYGIGEYEQKESAVSDIPRTLPNTNIYSNRYRRANRIGDSTSRTSDVGGEIAKNPYRKEFTSAYSRAVIDDSNMYKNLKQGIASLNKTRTSVSNATPDIQDTRRLVTAPAVDTQERLRSQLDILREVKTIADHENIYDGFPVGLETKLVSLRNAHSKLLQMLRERTAKIEEQKRHDINATVLANIPSTVTSASPRDEVMSNTITTSVNGRPNNNIANNSINGTPYVRTKAAPTTNPEETKYIQQLVDIARELR